jgi:spore germination protein YaaH
MHMTRNTIAASFLFLAFTLGYFVLPKTGEAATKAVTQKLEVSGWIPYWRKATGTAEALAHLNTFTEINPFGYTLKKDGTIFDAGKLGEEPWTTLIAEAKKKKIRVIPTIMSGDGATLHTLLSNQKSRIALEDAIVALVKQNNFDGIDIDFEGKKAETKTYFATFLKGLYQRMGNKWVMCTIEARTPLSSRYTGTPPADATMYANDYVAINKYCDRIRIMAYDQGTIDVVLNKARSAPYIPVSDPGWVEKVLLQALESFPKKKVMLGIATYGYEYQVTPLSEYGYRYDREWAFNPKYAIDLANQFGITPKRNAANEMSFSYDPSILVPPPAASESTSGTASAGSSSQVAVTTAEGATLQKKENIVWWSDAVAIKDKVDLAKRLGIRGVSIFKIDGGADPAMWGVLK